MVYVQFNDDGGVIGPLSEETGDGILYALTRIYLEHDIYTDVEIIEDISNIPSNKISALPVMRPQGSNEKYISNIFARGAIVKVRTPSHPSFLKNRTYWVVGYVDGLVSIQSDDYKTKILAEDIGYLTEKELKEMHNA